MERTAAGDGDQAPGIAEGEPLEITFKPFKVMTWWIWLFLVWLGGSFALADYIQAAHTPYIKVVSLILVVVFCLLAVAVCAPRMRVQDMGGTPPLRLGADGAELPLGLSSLKTADVRYEDIRSAAIFGRSRHARLLIDTPQRAFRYSVRAFADPRAPARVLALLQERIAARQGGARQGEEISRRQALAAAQSAVRPRATQALLAIILAVFVLEPFVLSGIFQDIDLGSNAAFLVRQGQWFRLVTANFLHGGFAHLFDNALFLAFLGVMVERQLGLRRYLVLILSAGLASQAVETAWTEAGRGSIHLYALGASGIVFGLIGAQMAFNLRFGRPLPWLYYFSPRGWWLLIAAFAASGILTDERVSGAAHMGGFLCGFAAGWLLCREQGNDMAAPPPQGRAETAALVLLSLLWLGGVALTVAHARDAGALRADHLALARAELALPKSIPVAENGIAWAFATDPKAGQEELELAEALARRAVTSAQANIRDKHTRVEEFTDTLATVAYRRGDLNGAIELEQPLLPHGQPYGSQMARFLAAFAAAHGPRLLYAGAAAPTADLKPDFPGGLAVRLSLAAPAPNGAEIFALVRKEGRLAGMLRFFVLPGAAQAEGSLPEKGFGGTGAQKLEWVVAQIDTTGCHCAPGSPAAADGAWSPAGTGDGGIPAAFFAFDPEIGALP